MADLFVRQLLGLDEGRARGLLKMCEVEPEPVGADERALLADMGAKHRAQRSMEQVRAGVVPGSTCAPLHVDCRLCGLMYPNCAFANVATVHDGAAGRLSVFHRKDAGRSANVPPVAHLPAAFRVEGGCVEDDLAGVALGGDIHQRVGLQDRDNACV